MENQVDITKYLEDTVEGCQIDIVREHLLKDILPTEEYETPYLLVSKTSDTDNVKSPGTQSNTSHTSSVGGSPLKLTEYYVGRGTVSCSKTGVTYKPCTISDARQLISAYQLQCQEENICHPVLPLWVLCDEDDPQNTVAMSSHVRKMEADEYLFKSHVVTVIGPQSEKEVTSKLSTVLKNVSYQSNGSSKRVDVNCSATYNVFGALGSRDVSLDQIQTASSTMNLHLTWNKLSLSLVPPRDARALVRVTVVAGDERSAAFSRHRELTILLELIRGVEKNEIHWTSEYSDITPLVRVTKLLDDMKSGNSLYSVEDGDTDSPAPVTLTSHSRKDLDFTEQLWMILKDCTSNGELIECLKRIFNCLKSGKIQPMVHRTNKTTMAELVRESFHNKMTAPTMEGAGAVNLLIDLGIEKIARDYISTFVGQELVTLRHLTSFLTNDKDLSFVERAERLDKLHYALELAVLLDQFVHVPHATLSLCARQALKYYEQNATEPHHEFTIPLQTSVVTGYIENCRPCEYQVMFTRHHCDHKSHSVVHLSTQPLLSLLNSASLSESCSEGDDRCSYYLTTVTENIVSL